MRFSILSRRSSRSTFGASINRPVETNIRAEIGARLAFLGGQRSKLTPSGWIERNTQVRQALVSGLASNPHISN
jgi:hypothetical protein